MNTDSCTITTGNEAVTMPSNDARLRILELFRSKTRQSLSKSELLLKANETPDGVYLLHRGYVKVYVVRNTGDLSLLLIHKPGEIFPLTWVYRGSTDPVYVEAMDKVVVYRCSRVQFRSFVAGDGEVAEFMLEQLAEMYWAFASRVENLELALSYDKVLCRLLRLAERMGRSNDRGEVVIEAPITHQDIADSLHMNRETASREIDKLRKMGLVHQRNRRFVIPNIERLRNEMAKIRNES